MATIFKLPNGRFKAVLRSPQGRYLRSKTFTRKTDATTWVRRLEADREAMAALGDELQPVSGTCPGRAKTLIYRLTGRGSIINIRDLWLMPLRLSSVGRANDC